MVLRGKIEEKGEKKYSAMENSKPPKKGDKETLRKRTRKLLSGLKLFKRGSEEEMKGGETHLSRTKTIGSCWFGTTQPSTPEKGKS